MSLEGKISNMREIKFNTNKYSEYNVITLFFYLNEEPPTSSIFITYIQKVLSKVILGLKKLLYQLKLIKIMIFLMVKY
jgi:hypothetical protein